LSGRLDALNPANVLKRGYAMLTDSTTGRIISSVTAASPGMPVRADVADGTIELIVADTRA